LAVMIVVIGGVWSLTGCNDFGEAQQGDPKRTQKVDGKATVNGKNPANSKYDIKYDMSYLEKTWNLKVKSLTLSGEPPHTQIKMLLEFRTDVDDLKEMRQSLAGSPSGGAVWFYLFDEDNVVLHKTRIQATEGELTGKKGDAFRMYVDTMPQYYLQKTKK